MALWALAFLGSWVGGVQGQEERELRVCLVNDAATPLLVEAGLRIEGELKAAGFLLVRGQPSAGGYAARPCPPGAGELGLVQEGNVLHIRALVPGREQALLQDIELTGASVSSEMVAVRAVEALRAAALDALQRGERAVDPTWSDFAQGTPPAPREAEPAPKAAGTSGTPKAELERPTEPPAKQPPEKPPSRWDRPWGIGVGAGAGGTSSSLDALAALSLDYEFRWLSLGARVYGSLSPERTDAPSASLLLRQYGADLRAVFVPPVSDTWSVGLGAAAGLFHLRIDAIDRTSSPQTFAATSHSALEIGAGGWLGLRVAGDLELRAEGWVSSVLDAPRVFLAGTEVLLGRPHWNVTVGPVLRR